MNAVYLETSAVLRWLLGEPEAPGIARRIQEAEEPVCSVLTILEVHRALTRARRDRPSRDQKLRRLAGQPAEASADWSMLEITPDIRVRAGEPFPVEPVRTLDAIHLATALRFARALPGLRMLSFDARILANLEPLSLLAATAEP